MLSQRNPLNQTTQTSRTAGDTLIEVMLAITLFSVVVVSALTMMNQGTATSQRSLEITLVRQAIDGQADTLRFLQNSYVENYYSGIIFDTADALTSPAEEYYKIIQRVSATSQTSPFGQVPCGTPPANSFVLNTKTATMVTSAGIFNDPATFAQLNYTGNVLDSSDGVWVEGVRSGIAGTTSYIDFHIRGCWETVNTSVPMNLGTIVRLYEPRG